MILLCSDLDRTLIPNGEQPESPAARPLLNRLADSGLVRLAYVSGRDRTLVEEAIGEYGLPRPEFVIGDVGTTLYRVNGDEWHLSEAWLESIAADWNGYEHGDIVALLDSLDEIDLELQPESQQSRHKVSYFTAPDESGRTLQGPILDLLEQKAIRANLIWSVDEAERRGLLDILPSNAGKISAIRFLIDRESIPEDLAVFAGDSGNDLDALTSGLKAILVKNAAGDVRREALAIASRKQTVENLYLPGGNRCSMNGNYGAGVLEGLAHFFPDLADWLDRELAHLGRQA